MTHDLRITTQILKTQAGYLPHAPVGRGLPATLPLGAMETPRFQNGCKKLEPSGKFGSTKRKLSARKWVDTEDG